MALPPVVVTNSCVSTVARGLPLSQGRLTQALRMPRSGGGRGEFEVSSFEAVNALAEPVGDRMRLTLNQVDKDKRLLRRHHQGVILDTVGGTFVPHARAADAGDADVDLEQVVE